MREPPLTQPERKRLKLSQLKPYPLQAQTYTPTSQAEDERLLAILRTGHYDPLHVMPPKNAAGLPAYTLLDGHRRAGLLANLEMDEAEVVLRHDLAAADQATVNGIFYDFALGRRHSHPLDFARMILRKYEIEKGRRRGELMSWDESEARDRVGKAIGMSGRNLCRYFRVLLTPMEVQNAVRDGELSLVLGEKVSWLPKDQQAEIAGRIHGGEKVEDVVRDYVASSSGRHQKPGDAFRAFVKHLEADLADLEGRTDKIYRKEIKEKLPLFARATNLLACLRREGKKKFVKLSCPTEKLKALGSQLDTRRAYFDGEQ